VRAPDHDPPPHAPALRAFGSDAPLPAAALSASGPPRYPRPQRWNAPLELKPARAAEAALKLGLATVGDLLEHLPRDRSAARTVAGLVPGETATVVVEVRSISSRPVRRRGMRPLVEAVVADETGPMKATFFNQPWLERRYRPGTRLMLQGKFEGRNAFRVQGHAPTAEAPAPTARSPPIRPPRGLTSTQILATLREQREIAAHAIEPLPARMRVEEALPDRTAALLAAHFGDHEAGRSRLAFEELLFLQIALLRRRAERRASARATPLPAPGDLTRRWLATGLPFTPTGDPDGGDGRDRRRPHG
jgi:ATP-dependent DNA helicase RecG